MFCTLLDKLVFFQSGLLCFYMLLSKSVTVQVNSVEVPEVALPLFALRIFGFLYCYLVLVLLLKNRLYIQTPLFLGLC